MPATDKYGFPAPDYPDDSNGPEQLLALGQAVENLLSVGAVDLKGGTIEVAAPTAANHPVTKAWFEGRLVIGPTASAPPAGGLPSGSIYFGID